MDEHHTSDYPLIEQYLAGLQRDLAGRPDRHEVVAELRDHLLAAAERHERSGQTPADAERSAIADIGEPELVARAFVENRRGVPAVPTAFTRFASLGGYVAAAGALVSAVGAAMAERSEGEAGTNVLWYGAVSVGILLLTYGFLVLLIGTVRRHGGLGALGWIAIGVGVCGALISIIAWAVAVWAGLVAASWLLALGATWRAGLAPRAPMAAVVVGLGSLPLLIIAADELAQAGRGGTTLGAVVGRATVVASVALVVMGGVGLARWLEGEEPVAPESPQVLAT